MDCQKMCGRGILVAALICIGMLIAPGRALAVPICIDDLCIQVPTERDMGYVVHSGDFNGDGRTDLYVTGGSFRAVKDFIITQDAPDPATGAFNFSVIATPTAAQAAAGRSAPVTSVTVYRVDLTRDGLLDFQFENVEEVIPGAPNIIILTSKGTGNVPVKVIKEDDKFLDLIDQIEGAMQNMDAVLNIWNQVVCVPILSYVQYSYNVWVPTGSFAPGGGGGYYQTYYTWVPVQLGNACWPIGSYYGSGPLKTFLDQMSAFRGSLPAGTLTFSNTGIDAAEGRVILKGGRVVSKFRRYAEAIKVLATAYRYYRNGALVIGVGMLADDVTVVGIADDPAAVAVLITAGEAIVLEVTLNAIANHLEAKAREEEAAPGVDPYAIKANCTPWNPTKRALMDLAKIGRTIERNPDSAKLRANMNLSGCDCPSGEDINAAHHIIRKDPGKVGDTVVQGAIDCLNRNGVDIDEAGNGVCLPTRDNSKTSAIRHGTGGMHSRPYNQAVLQRCLDAENAGSTSAEKAQKVRDALDMMRQQLSTGQVFW